MKKTFLLLSLSLSFLTGISQVSLIWSRRYNSEGHGSDRPVGTVSDPSGNIYVAGTSDGYYSGSDFLTVKYSPIGDTLWTRRYNGNPSGYQTPDVVHDLNIDASGFIYVTGESQNTSNDMVTVKYDALGNQVWVARYGVGNNFCYANDAVIDGNGNCYMTGMIDSSGQKNYKTVKFNNAGVFQWARTYNGTMNFVDQAYSITLDNAGNVIVTGESMSSGVGYDYATIKYDPNGNQLWLQKYNGAANAADHGYVVRTDNANNVYVVGASVAISASNEAYALVKYNSSGAQQWVAIYDPDLTAGWDVPKDMVVDPNGDAFVTGFSSSSTGYDYATWKVNASGIQQWISRYNGSGNGNDIAFCIRRDAAGCCYVSGRAANTGTGNDGVTIKYSPSGATIWVRTFNGPFNGDDFNTATGALVTGAKVAFTGGSYKRFVYDEDYVTLQYDTAGNQEWVKRYNGTLSSTDFSTVVREDSSRYIYVGGFTNGGGYSNDDAVLLKYDSLGALLWDRVYNGPRFGNERVKDLVSDRFGNIFATGYSDTIGTGKKDILVLKYSSSGSLLWAQTWNGANNLDDIANSIGTDDSGNVYVTGYTSLSSTNKNAVVIKYYASGNLAWSVSYGGVNNDAGNRLVVDNSANIYMVGYTTVTTYDYLTVKYDRNGTQIWAKVFDDSLAFNDYGSDITTDASGNVYVTGQSMSNYGTIKYDANGNELWHKYYVWSWTDSASTVRVDAAGNVVVTGKSYGGATWDGATVKYSPSGAQLWAVRIVNPTDEELYDLDLDASGNVYACGYKTVSFSTNQDIKTIKYNSSGTQQWEVHYTNAPGIRREIGRSIDPAATGSVYVTGESEEAYFNFGTGLYDMVLLKYVPGVVTTVPPYDFRDDQTLVLYPNPAANLLTLQFLTEKKTTIRITDLAGRILFEREDVPENGAILIHPDISFLADGFYSVLVQNSDVSVGQILVIAR